MVLRVMLTFWMALACWMPLASLALIVLSILSLVWGGNYFLKCWYYFPVGLVAIYIFFLYLFYERYDERQPNVVAEWRAVCVKYANPIALVYRCLYFLGSLVWGLLLALLASSIAKDEKEAMVEEP